MDWQRDESLDSWIEAANQRQRYHAAALAVRRLRAPLLQIEMPGEWGVAVSLADALFDAMAAGPGARFTDLVAELRTTPLFSSEVDANLAQEVQLNAIDGLQSLGDAQHDLDAATTERIISHARGQAHYLDEFVADQPMPDPLEPDPLEPDPLEEEAHQRYLAGLGADVREYGLDYYGSRNIDVEFACRAVIDARDGDGLLASPAGRELFELCDRFSGELVAGIRAVADE
jgi:hypothetical protein